MERALISVTDKTGIVDFARALSAMGIEVLSTGGTYKVLKEAGVKPLREVAEVTGFPEMLDGRVKTIHPRIAEGFRDALQIRAYGRARGARDSTGRPGLREPV